MLIDASFECAPKTVLRSFTSIVNTSPYSLFANEASFNFLIRYSGR